MTCSKHHESNETKQIIIYRNPTLTECEDETHTPEMGTWESFEIPETSKFNCRGQSTSHWGVLYIIGKLWKWRCRKWACMGHFNFYNTWWQKERSGIKLAIWLSTTKSRESTQPQCMQAECDTSLESSWGKLQVCSRSHPNRRSEKRVMTSQSPESLNRNSFGTLPWESWDKKPFGCKCQGEAQRILYGGRWWLPLSPGCGEFCESKVAHGLS